MAWICEPGIDARELVRRVTNERLRSFADEQKAAGRVPDLAARERQVHEMIAALHETATALGYTTNKLYLRSDPPGMRRLVANMFDEHLGDLLYHLMSSASHGRVAGTMRSVVADPAPGLIGPQTGRIGLQLLHAAIQASALLICLQQGVAPVARPQRVGHDGLEPTVGRRSSRS